MIYRSDQKILDLTEDELYDVVLGIHNQGLAVFYEQDMCEKDFVELGYRLGIPEAPGMFMNPKKYPEIFLVTGQRDSAGNKIGMFGKTELGWHSNGNSRHLIDKILVNLYCVKSDINTTTSWCNTSLPFYDLSKDEQEYWKSIKIRLKFQNNIWAHLEEEDDPELEILSAHGGSIRDLVGVHPHTGKYYFYFPYDFIIRAWENKRKINADDMIEQLKKIIFKQKYQYHHIFNSGDLILSDQFSSLHRRTPIMDDRRLLWRLAGDFKNIHKDQ